MTLGEIEAKLKLEQNKLNSLIRKILEKNGSLQDKAIIKQSNIVNQLLNLQYSYKR